MRFFRPLAPVRAMTFDLDDTLYDNGPVIRQAETALQEHIARHYPQTARLARTDWQRIRQQLLSQTPALASDMGQLRLRTLSAALQADIDDDSALAEAAQACFECFYDARSELTLTDEMHQTLAALAQRVPLVAITNGNVDPQKIGIAPYFEAFLHASVRRPMKPHRKMFDEAVAQLQLPAANILHVGDSLTKDVTGAIAAGKQAAWFACNRPMDLRGERVGVLPHVQIDSFSELLALV